MTNYTYIYIDFGFKLRGTTFQQSLLELLSSPRYLPEIYHNRMVISENDNKGGKENCKHLPEYVRAKDLPSRQEKMDINSASRVVDNLQGLFNNFTM